MRNKRNLQSLDWRGCQGIGIVDLHAPADVKQLKIKKGSFPQYITWSADGRYIAYALCDSQDQLSCFAVRVNGGKQHIPIFRAFEGGLRTFEWTRKKYFPTNVLTTTWAELKASGLTGVGDE